MQIYLVGHNRFCWNERQRWLSAVKKFNYFAGKTEMVGKYNVITLCGSTRFKDAFMDAQKRLTLEGNIVISVGLFGHLSDCEECSEMVWSKHDEESICWLL